MKKTLLGCTLIILLFSGCAGNANVANIPDELDLAIRDASDYLNDNIPEGSMIVILNIQSDSSALSEYVIDELIANAVNDRIFTVVDRQQLDLIRTEQNFQLSGEVDDDLALSIGKFFGAQVIVSGRVSQIGDRYRMSIRALDVQTARVQGQYNRNILAGRTIVALMRSGGASVAGAQSTAARTSGSSSSGSVAASGTDSRAAASTTSEPAPEGALVVSSVSNWNTAINTIRNGGNGQTYIIHVTGNVSVPAIPNNENLFGSVTGITVTIQGGGTLALSVDTSLLQIGAGQTIIVRNVTLRGRNNNNSNAIVTVLGGGIFRMEDRALITGNTIRIGFGGGGVQVKGGTFIMEGGTISGNTSMVNGGGGISVDSGTFTMQGGMISGNTSNNSGGGGVQVTGGTFIMEDGTISGNTSTGGPNEGGGGVRVTGGSFIMEDGTISGNTANYGGGVYVNSGTFTMQGGTISGNTGRRDGGGVYNYLSLGGGRGTFTMRGGTITGGNTTNGNGGGVFVNGGTFTKTGGTISGSDLSFGERNIASGQGNAIYSGQSYRNATAGPNDNTDGYGFWLND